VTFANIFASVLAFVAVISVVALWLTFTLHRRSMASWRSTTVNALQKIAASAAAELKKTQDLQRELQRSTPATLGAEVAELSAAVAKLAATQRRFAGKFHAERQHSPVSNGEFKAGGSGGEDVDDEIAAHLALQTAPPARPG